MIRPRDLQLLAALCETTAGMAYDASKFARYGYFLCMVEETRVLKERARALEAAIERLEAKSRAVEKKNDEVEKMRET